MENLSKLKAFKILKLICFIVFLQIFSNCKPENSKLISEKYIDSLLNIKSLSAHEKLVATDLLFWKSRYEKDTTGYVNAQEYAGMLLAKFHLYGNIEDLKKGEAIIQKLNKDYKGAESGLNRNLSNYASLQHRFSEAHAFAIKASQIGDNQYQSQLLLFDMTFELGKIEQAKLILNKLNKKYEYAYYFRLAKMQHYDGELEKAIKSMKMASTLTFGNIYLQQAALSNIADLQLHAGDYVQAKENYLASLAIDKADLHSFKGLGIIAQNNDKNYDLADKIYQFIAKKTESPDIYFNLSQLAQSTENKVLELKYAKIFSEKASKNIYGNMYNKYLIELNDGVLNNSKTMLAIAEKEIENRKTAQTNSWYSWALYKNNQKEKALAIYKKSIAEKPLEGLELYFMGKMMEAEKKSQNAKAYFEAAFKNRFELSPSKKMEIENIVNA